jgi:natural product biosynthesis luciferase-like monooxygenase protein
MSVKSNTIPIERSALGSAPLTLIELLRWRALHQPEFVSYTFLEDGESKEAHLTYRDLDRQARAIGTLLQNLVAKGERVLLLYPPGLEYIAAFFGCLCAGAIAVPAYPPRLNRSMARLLAVAQDSQASVALTTGQILSKVEALFAQSPNLKSLRFLATDNISPALSDQWHDPMVCGDAIAFLQYTSGSTSTPRGVLVSHSNLLHNEGMIRQAFRQTEESVILSWLPLYHDMGLIGGMLQPLYVGARCILMSPIAFLQRPLRWLQAISRYRATTSGGPNFAYDLCVRKVTRKDCAALDLSGWDVAFNGSEPVRAETLDRFAARFESCGFRREAFYPCYGLAEATLIVSGGATSSQPTVKAVQARSLENACIVGASHGEEATRLLVSSGRLSPEQEVVIVDPESLTLCPPDHIGEIWVSGNSIARGYWNRPEETEKTFCAHLADGGRGPFLRTGDLGFIEGGELFVTGRLKDLIIIRGRNHYPQDIEMTVEQCHPSLRQGCGAAFSVDVSGEEHLVIAQEVENHHDSDLDVVIQSICQSVSDHHELQVYAVALVKSGSIPKTSSGKIQHRACQERFLSGSLNTVALWQRAVSPEIELEPWTSMGPLHGIEQIEAWLVEQVAARTGLDLDSIDVNQPISHYALDSLGVVELMYGMETTLGASLPMAAFFQSPSIAQLAAQCSSHLAVADSDSRVGPVSARAVMKDYPLSRGQHALWFLYRLSPDTSAYNIVSAVCIRGELDIWALKRAFQALVDRHPSLRTTFAIVQAQPLQRVHEQTEVCFNQQDASTWTEEYLNEKIIEQAHLPIDLEQGPLLRINLFTRSAHEHVLLLVVHHIIVDFWSLTVLAHELGILYSAERYATRATLDLPRLRYGDYVLWQAEFLESPEAERLWAYWQRQMAGELPTLKLLTDRPRPPVQTYDGTAQFFKINAELTRGLKEVGDARGATLYMTLLAAFQVLLYRYTGQEEFLVGSPTSGRPSAALANVVGYFINPVVLRADLSGDHTFNSFLGQVRQTVLAAFEHQDYPFGLLAERLQQARDPSTSPLFQVLFTLQRAHLPEEQALASFVVGEAKARVNLGELQMESLPVEHRVSQFDFTLMMAETGLGLAASLRYNTNLFDATTIARMAGHLQSLLEGIVAVPEHHLLDLPILSAAERHQLLIGSNDTRAYYPRDHCIHDLFEAQAERTPDKIAVVFQEQQVTYRELNARANQLAHYLRHLNVGPETRVGLYMERSLDMVVAMLGILKAGGAYVPLDPDFPSERIAFMLEDAHAAVLLTKKRLAEPLPPHAAQVVCLDEEWGAISSGGGQNPMSHAGSENLAYMIYTSGSTGRPKGVMVCHRNVVNFIAAMDACLGGKSNGVWLAVTSISFDISVLELLWTLSRGFKVVVLGEHQAMLSSALSASRASDRGIDFSLFYFASDERESTEGKYKLLIEGAKFADRRGFSAVWTPERHFHAFGGLYPNPSVTSAAIAMVTERIQIRAGSVVLPLHNVLRVAEEWSVIDNLSGGRVGISFASGWHADDFVLAPENYANRKEIMARQIETVRKLWRGESVRLRGGAGNEVDVKILPRPVQPELPIWITAAGATETFEAAGRSGANLLTHLLGQSVEELAEKISVYRQAWRKQGHGPGQGHVTLMLHTFIGQDIDRVRQQVREPFCNYLKSSIGLISNFARSLGRDIHSKDFTQDDMDALLSYAFDRYFESSGLMGTPSTCSAMISQLKAIGVDELACLIDFGVDYDAVMASLERLDLLRKQSNEKRADGGEDYSLAEQMKRHDVSHLQCTPSLARLLAMDEESLNALEPLNKLLLGGEALPASLANQLGRIVAGDIHNMYGPTETTIWSASDLVEKSGTKITIGRPLANTQIYIVNKHLQPAPVGVPGDLYIGGEGVVRGYFNRPDLSAERFIPDPFSSEPGARLYKTGDLARYLPDGRVEFLGRDDSQVKIRGFRIEPGEIEATLAMHPPVTESVVIAHEDAPGEARLVAYVAAAPDGLPAIAELRAFLKERLPEYMVPSTFVFMESLPLTPNGKINRRALPPPPKTAPENERTFVAPRTAVEEVLAGLWSEILGFERVSVHDNFFEMGGHSLLASQLISQLRDTFQVELPLRKLFEEPTVAGLAEVLLADPQKRSRVERIAEVLIRVAQFSEEEAEAMLNENVLSPDEGSMK